MKRRIALFVLLVAVSSCGPNGSVPVSPGPDDGAPTEPDLGALALHALIGRAGGQIGGYVRIGNPTSSPVRLELPGVCELELLVLPAGEASVEPLWDQRGWFGSRPGGCSSSGQVREIATGGSVQLFTHAVPERAILGDSIPAGEYTLAVRVRFPGSPETTRALAVGTFGLEDREPTEGGPNVRDEPGGPTAAPWVRTDRAEYELVETSIGWETTIGFEWTNPTDGPAFIVHCNEAYDVVLEKRVDEAWVRGWSPFLPRCLSIPPITVGAGATLEHRIRVFGGFPVQFTHEEPEGTYRLVLFPVDASESSSFPFGDEVPFETRVSNAFRLVVVR